MSFLWILGVVLKKAQETFKFLSFYFCPSVSWCSMVFWSYIKIVGPEFSGLPEVFCGPLNFIIKSLNFGGWKGP